MRGDLLRFTPPVSFQHHCRFIMGDFVMLAAALRSHRQLHAQLGPALFDPDVSLEQQAKGLGEPEHDKATGYRSNRGPVIREQWDESKLKPYPAGTLYSEPAKTPHYAWAKDGEVILQVTAIGPTGNTPIPQKQ